MPSYFTEEDRLRWNQAIKRHENGEISDAEMYAERNRAMDLVSLGSIADADPEWAERRAKEIHAS